MRVEITNLKKYDGFEFISTEDLISEDIVFFYGSDTLDNRCIESTTYFKKYIKNFFKLIYNEDKFILNLSKKEEKIDYKLIDFGKEFIKKLEFNTFILDTTSLGFAEILLLVHFISEKENVTIKLYYVEPNEYKLKNEKSMFKNEFDLSEGFNSFKKIPPYSLLIDSSSSSKAKLVSLLGFENDRLSRILEDDDGARYDEFIHIVALPAFSPGWENISLHRHSRELKNAKNIEFSPANNPYETYRVLEKIQKNSKNKNLVIAPIGTKPHAIGAIIFLINSRLNKDKVGIIYDFPIKKENRTDGVGIIHEYVVKSII